MTVPAVSRAPLVAHRPAPLWGRLADIAVVVLLLFGALGGAHRRLPHRGAGLRLSVTSWTRRRSSPRC